MKKTIITCGIYLYSTSQQRLLVCHATHSPWNRWSIPKGLKDEGETSFDAAIRELYEETGLKYKELHIISKHALKPVNYQKQKKILESFLLITDVDLSHQTFICHSHTEKSFPEVDSWKWITLEQAVKWLHEAQQKNLEEIEQLVKAAKK